MFASTSNLRRVVARCRTRDALAVRLGLEQSLGSLDWTPPGLVETAILCVRVFGDPLPRAWRFGRPTIEWRAALRNALGQEAQRAARPAREPVGANANAVWFADHAELLACLAIDWLRGDTAVRWWWQSLFPGRSLGEAVRQAWAGTPEHVPAALDRLHNAGRSGDFLNALPAALVAAICTNVARAFALEQLRDAITRAVVAERVGPTSGETRRSAPDREANPVTDAIPEVQPAGPLPWTNWVQVQSAMPPEAQSLLVLSIMLIRESTLVRSLSFLGRVRDFAGQREFPEADQAPAALQAEREDVSSISAGRSLSNSGQLVAREAGPASLQAGGLALDGSARLLSTPGQIVEGEILSPPRQIGDSSLKRDGALPSTPGQSASNKIRPISCGGQRGQDQLLFATDVNQYVCSEAGNQTSILPDARDQPIERVWSTEWGGVFYLINVAIALELYGDFTRPCHPSLPLTVWDFLALMGRRLVGEQFKQDPCWNALTALSGRAEADPPGVWFEPPDEWRLPLSWLAPFPEQTGWRGGHANGRVWLAHPDGFTVLDLPCRGADPMNDFRHECDSLGLTLDAVSRLQGSEFRDTESRSLDRWVNWLAQYFEARLSRSLNEPDPEALRELVFRHDARVRINSERVTIQFPLAAHPIALRLAGLDRNPGWVPAAGRTIAFQYD